MSRERHPKIDEGVGSPETFFSLKLVEANGMDRLISGDSSDFDGSQWEKYRYTQ
jgi:hypothetical protein